MTDRTLSRVICEPQCGIKKIILRTGTTVVAGTDTVTLTLANFGCDRLLSVYGVYQTTENSVMLQESCTTAVSSGVLTITTQDVGGDSSTDDKKRVYTVWAESAA